MLPMLSRLAPLRQAAPRVISGQLSALREARRGGSTFQAPAWQEASVDGIGIQTRGVHLRDHHTGPRLSPVVVSERAAIQAAFERMHAERLHVEYQRF